MNKKLLFVASISAAILASGPVLAKKKTKTPAEGFNIHIVAPHRHDGWHDTWSLSPLCKSINPEILQCMIFTSTDSNAELIEIEYFISKKLMRSNVTLEQWNKHFHDHKEEVASGRDQVLDVPPKKAKQPA